MTQSIYWRGSDVNSAEFRSVSPSHPPAWKHKSSFVLASTCLALHVPGCFVALSAHLFKESLSISLRLFIQLSLGLLLSHWWFVLFCFFFPVGFGIPFMERTLFSSYPFQRMGPGRQNGWLWAPSSLSPPPHSVLLAIPWCHGSYPLQGYPLIFLSPLHTPYISPFHLFYTPPTNPQSCTPFYPQPVTFSNSLASQ